MYISVDMADMLDT